MRYWIYWNDLVQGPFELDELSTLKALSEDLPVCLEDRTDWLPACRIADLAPIIEERRSARMPPPPPPPPPTGRPAADPLQGEFFTEAPNQKWLFPDNDPSKGPFAFSPTQLEMKTVFPDVMFTSPIRFYGGGAAVATAPSTRSVFAPEKRDVFIPMNADVFTSRESAAPELKEDLTEESAIPPISLEIYPDVPETIQADVSEFPPLSVEEQSSDRSTARVAGWVTGILAALLLIGSLSYKWFDSSTSRAAINEAKTRLRTVKPIIPTDAKSFSTELPKTYGDRQQDAIELVKNYSIPKINQTVDERAQIMGQEASGGKKPVWNGQHITGLLYQVSLVIPAKQPGGAAHAYSFLADLVHQTVSSDDGATEARFMKAKKKLSHDGTFAVIPAKAGTQSSVKRLFSAEDGLRPDFRRGDVNDKTSRRDRTAVVTNAAPKSGGDAWKNREQEAKDLVVNKNISKINQTIGQRAEAMVDQGNGQTKASWDALQIKGSLYRVSLILSSSQPGGVDAVQVYPFTVDLKNQKVSTDDANASANFLKAKKRLTRKDVSTPAPVVVSPSTSDGWKNREQDAKDLVINKKIPQGNQTVGERAQAMVDRANGQTNATWEALQTKSSLYRVSLILSSSHPGAADAVQVYPFLVDLKNNSVFSDDQGTVANFLRAKEKLSSKTAGNSAAVPGVLAMTNSSAASGGSANAAPVADGDVWKNREQEAKDLVMNKQIPKIGQTVGERAQAMADLSNGQTKAIWDALQTKDSLYHVSLILANRIYPFQVDLQNQKVSTDDAETTSKFLKAKKKLIGKQSSDASSVVAPVPGVTSTQTPGTTTSATAIPDDKPDPWKDRFKEAIALTTNKKIDPTNQTAGERAAIMLEGMHDKELLYAADNGQRLYLPDKLAWTALRETGPLYRVYLGFSADQANGERLQTQSYQFQANLELHVVVTDDPATAADFLNAKTALVHNRDPRAADIQNILSAVDLLNKQLMRAIIVKDSRKNRLEEKDIAAAIKAVIKRFQRAVIYFRTKYPDTMLQNVAKAYSFTKLLKDHV